MVTEPRPLTATEQQLASLMGTAHALGISKANMDIRVEDLGDLNLTANITGDPRGATGYDVARNSYNQDSLRDAVTQYVTAPAE